jgi:hypothetical protein
MTDKPEFRLCNLYRSPAGEGVGSPHQARHQRKILVWLSRRRGRQAWRFDDRNESGRQLSHRDPIIESDPPRRLVYGWKPLENDKPDERPSQVTFDLAPFKGQTRLTVIHDEFDEGSKIFGMISKGWPAVLSSLKSLLETGRGLDPSWSEEGQHRVAEAGA